MLIRRILLIVAIGSLLQGCGPGWGLAAVNTGLLQANMVAEDLRERAEISKQMEPELTKYSIEAIQKGQVVDIERTYLQIYEDTSQSNNIRAAALYQIALIYSVPTHRLHDNERALYYLEKLLVEFPEYQNNLNVSEHLAKLQDPNRRHQKYTPNKLLIDKNRGTEAKDAKERGLE